MPFTVSINNNVFGGGEASSLDQKECSKENGLSGHRVLVTSLWLYGSEFQRSIAAEFLNLSQLENKARLAPSLASNPFHPFPPR